MKEPLVIPWLDWEDPNPMPMRLPKAAIDAAAKRRGGVRPAPRDWRCIGKVDLQTRLDATIDARFAPEGNVRGVEVLEVTWADTLRDDARLRAVVAWLAAAMPLNPLLVCFFHVLPDCVDTRLAIAVPGRGVAFGKIWSHCGIIDFIPECRKNVAPNAITALAWANALFDAVTGDAETAALRKRLAEAEAKWRRAKTAEDKVRLRAEVLRLQSQVDDR